MIKLVVILHAFIFTASYGVADKNSAYGDDGHVFVSTHELFFIFQLENILPSNLSNLKLSTSYGRSIDLKSY